MNRIESYQVGDTAHIEHLITADDIDKFVELTGDDNRLHVDADYAKKTSFKGVVAHGMLGASFISTIIGKHIPGDGALWVSQNLQFLLPIRIGDKLTIAAEVIHVQKRQKLLTLSIKIINQHKQLVQTGESQVKVLDLEESKIKMEQELQKKVVLVTGGATGIGAAVSALLANEGYHVLINYRNNKMGAENLKQEILAQGGSAKIFQADVTHRESVEKMVQATIREFGAVTALVNNATSKIIPQEFDTLEWDDIETHLRVQIQGAFNCITCVIPELIKHQGSVVNVSTIYTSSTPPAKLSGYIMAKAAIEALTKSLAVEYGPQGVRFNTVSPGMTETALIADIPEKVRLLTAAQTPLKRLAQPENIAHAIAFLLSDQAQHITGENLKICGGSVMI